MADAKPPSKASQKKKAPPPPIVRGDCCLIHLPLIRALQVAGKGP
jgi:hypothetical protein